jgi:serine/threonine protein kinase
MKTTVIHPDFDFCADFINRLPEIFHAEGETIFTGRNELKIFKLHGLEFVVKSFKRPHFINKIAYSFLRASKAERAYRYAIMLLHKEISTPAPVAYIEIRKFGLLYDSFFVSIKSRFHREIREIANNPNLSEAYPVLNDFACFTAGLHKKGIFHKDYSPGNILFGKTDEGYEFELVDLNRIKFRKVSMKAGCKNFIRLGLNDEMYRFVTQQYAEASMLQK